MKNKNVIDPHAEHCGKDDKVVNGRECRSALPLVDGLRGAEPEDVLEILHRQTGVYTEAGDVDTRCGHVDDRYSIHFIYAPVPAQSRKGTGSVGLKVINRFQYFNHIDALADHVDNVR